MNGANNIGISLTGDDRQLLQILQQMEGHLKSLNAVAQQAMRGTNAAAEKAAQSLVEVERAARGSAAAVADAGQAMNGYVAMSRDARVEANLLRQANRQLSMQMTDVVTSLASGMPVWMVFLQQGGQIKDAYGGIGNALKGVAGYLRTLINPYTAAAAAAAAFGVAAFLGAREMDAYNKALVLSGNAAGTTAGALDQMAARIGDVAGTQARAAELLASMASAGDISAASLERVALAAIRLQRAGGPVAEETVKQFAALGKDPVDAVIKLNEKTNFLTRSLYQQVQALQDQGRTAEAAALAIDGYANAVDERSRQIEARLGYLERAWRAVADGAKGAWDWMLGLGRADSVEKQLSDLQKRIAQATANQDSARSDLKARYQPLIDALRVQEASLQEQVRLQRRSIDLTARQADRVRALAEWDKSAVQYLDDKAKIEKLIADTRALGVQAGASELEIERRIAAIRAQNAPKGGSQADASLKALAEATREHDKYVATLERGTQAATRENEAIADQVVSARLSKQAFDQLVDTRLEEQAVRLELQAIRALDKNLDEREYRALVAQAAALRQRIGLRQALAAATQEAVDREIMARRSALKDQDAADAADTDRLQKAQRLVDAIFAETAALQMSNAEREIHNALLSLEATGLEKGSYAYEQYAEKIRAAVLGRESVRESIAQTRQIEREWRQSAEQIGQALTDALMQGGKSAWEYIKGLFRSTVLRPIIQAVVSPVAMGVTSALGFSGSASASAGTGGAGGASTVATLASAYSALQNGVSTAIANGFTQLAHSAVGAKLGLSTPVMDPYTGVTANVQTSAAQSMGSALGTLGGTVFGTAAGMAINKAISDGFSVSRGMTTLQNIGTAVASYMFGPIGGMVAGAISGAVNRAFGRRLSDFGLQGTFGAGEGFAGQNFQLMQGGWFRSDKTNTSPMDTELQSALSAGFRQLQIQTALMAQTLGVSATAVADFTRDIRISFQGLNEEQIKERLAEQLTSLQEEMAAMVLGAGRTVTETVVDQVENWTETEQGPVFMGFSEQLREVSRTIDSAAPSFSRAGETAVQTLTRLSSSISAINPVLESLGLALYETSLAGADLASQLADAFGGLEAFGAATARYYAEFFSESERAANATEGLSQTLGGLGLTLPASREAYRALVEAQDLSTESGRRNFATLVQLAGAFAELNPVLEEAVDVGRSAADILQERAGLERQLLELQGDTTALRALDRAALDASNRALYDQITTLQDAQAAQERYNQALTNARTNLESARRAVETAQAAVNAIVGEGTSQYLDAQARVASAQQRLVDVQSQAANAAADAALKVRDLGRTLQSFVDGELSTPSEGFASVLRRALAGDAEAMQNLPAAAQGAIESSRAAARNAAEAAIQRARILSDVASVAKSALATPLVARPASEDPLTAAQRELDTARAALADALRVAQTIGAPLARSADDLIGRWQEAQRALWEATASLASAQQVLADIERNTSNTVSEVKNVAARTAKAELDVILKAVADSDLPDYIKTLILNKGSTYTTNITAVMDSDLGEAEKKLLLQANTMGMRAVVLSAAFSDVLTPEQQRALMVADETINRVIRASVLTGTLTNDQALILAQQAQTVTKTVNALMSGSLTGDQATILAQQGQTVTKIVNALANGALTSDQSVILAQQAQNVTKIVQAVASGSLTGDQATMLAQQGQTVTKIVQAVASGSLTSDQATILAQQGQTVTKTVQAIVDTSRLSGAQSEILDLISRSSASGSTVTLTGTVTFDPSYQLQLVLTDISRTNALINQQLQAQHLMIVNPDRRTVLGQSGPAYALGGAFSGSVIDSPTWFEPSVMGEAGPEAIMPLTRTSSGALGVRASMPYSSSGVDGAMSALVEEVQALREELAGLRAEARATAVATNKTARILDRVTPDGSSLQTVSAS